MILVATDLDGTLLGDAQATKNLLAKLQPLRESGQLCLAYVTGRSLEKYQMLREQEGLIEPDAVITSVGTEVYIGSELQPLTAFQSGFSLNWNRQLILDFCLNQVSLQPQSDSEQTDYKISFFGNTNFDYRNLDRQLHEMFPDTKLLISHSGEFVDIFPAQSGKARAVDVLAEHLRIDQADVYCAGDSGNDADMLESHKAIVVGNAYQELISRLVETDNSPLYFAKASYAAGVDEGLSHYLGDDWSGLSGFSQT